MYRFLRVLVLACLVNPIGPIAAAQAPGPIDFSLVDQNDKPVTSKSFSGRYALFFFGYTHCPDICPTTLQDMALLNKDLPEDMARKLSLVFVTGDPQRDTPAVLKEYLSYFDNRIIGLSGSLKEVDDLAWAMKAVIIRHGNGTGEYTVDHSVNYVLFHDGAILDQIPNTLTTEEMINRLRAKLGEIR